VIFLRAAQITTSNDVHVLSAHMADVESNCRIRIACALVAAPTNDDCDEEEEEEEEQEDEGSARGGMTNMAHGSDGAETSATNDEEDENEDEDEADRSRSVCSESGASAITAHREMKLRRRTKSIPNQPKTKEIKNLTITAQA
jgi:hypothetical protein